MTAWDGYRLGVCKFAKLEMVAMDPPDVYIHDFFLIFKRTY